MTRRDLQWFVGEVQRYRPLATVVLAVCMVAVLQTERGWSMWPAIAATVAWAFVILGWSPTWYPALRWVILGVGIAAADVSTGELRLTIATAGDAPAVLARFTPREVLVPESGAQAAREALKWERPV